VGWDQAVLTTITTHRTGWITALTRTVAAVGMSTHIYAAALLLCVTFGWIFRAWRAAAAAPLAAVLAVVVTEVAKDLIGRPRPPQALALLTAGGFSMPSSIGAMTAAAAMPVILVGVRMANRTGHVLIWLVTAATLLVGVSMVYLGAHWLSDVIAGWALGAAVGVAVFRLLCGRIRRRAAAGA
jgi:undecaprenyl-diphosphatase